MHTNERNTHFKNYEVDAVRCSLGHPNKSGTGPHAGKGAGTPTPRGQLVSTVLARCGRFRTIGFGPVLVQSS
jgi:hypothetical protein